MADALEQLRGSIIPVVTPFATDGSVDDAALRRLVDRQIAGGSHAVSCTGTTGEPSSLTVEERIGVMATIADQIGGRVPFVPATGSNNIGEGMRLTAEAKRLGAAAVMIIVPYYARPSQAGLIAYFSAIAESTTLPIILYNIPARTGVNLEPATMKRLRAKYEHIVGVKEANKDLEQVVRVLDACGRDFLVYSGIELLCLPMLAVGGAGHISATANITPGPLARMYEYARDGRWDEAREIHFRLFELNEALFWETNPGPVKVCLAQLGLIEPVIRLPLTLPDAAMQTRLREVLARYADLIPQAAWRA